MSSLTIKMFGSIQILVDDQPLPPFRSRKAIWLFALLTLRANRPVERERLASMLWPDNEHSRALANLRTVLSELRMALGEEGRRLSTYDRRLIVLDLDGASVDLLSFDAAVVSPDLKEVEGAIELYGGLLLEGCSEEWVYQERAAREQACLNALQRLADFALSSGNNKAALNWYRRASVIDPWWDSARRGMMEALARDGDINEALQVYRSFEELLRGDSRSVPDEQTTALYTRLRNRARKLRARQEEQPEDEPIQIEGYIPCPVNNLVGREDETNDVASVIRRSRFVTLTGVGGIGKTRLAIAVANEVAVEFTDGVWFVALETVIDGDLISQQIGAVLGISEKQGETWTQAISKYIRKKRLLIILDNCEHVLDSSTKVITHLLQECPGLRILTTSREIFGTAGESVWQVPGLAVPDPGNLPEGVTTMLRVLGSYEGVQFFVERAKAAQRDFALTPANARVIANICFQLDGVPLAVELAAARTKSMTVDQIFDRLGDHFNLLRSSSRSERPRQYALLSTLNWSHDLLSPAEQCLLRRLSIFVGGWNLSAAEEICSDPNSNFEGAIQKEDVHDLLTSLVDKSLVNFSTESGPRYRFLEMVRQYSKKRLDESGETQEIKARLLNWCVAEVEEAQGWIGRPEQLDWLKRLVADYENFRAVLEENLQPKKISNEALKIVAGLQVFWHRSGRIGEGWRFVKMALEADTIKSRTKTRAKLLRGAILLTGPEIDSKIINAFAEESLDISRELNDLGEVRHSVHVFGNIAFLRYDYDLAEKYFSEELVLSKELGDVRDFAMATCSLSIVHSSRGHYRAARILLDEAEPRIREVSDLNVLVWCLNRFGELVRSQGELDFAKALLEETLALSRSIGFTAVTGSALNGLACIANEQNEIDVARGLINECISISEEIGDMFGKSLWLRTLGLIAINDGNLDSAETHLAECLPLGQEFGDQRCRAGNLLATGKLAVLKHEYALALPKFSESLSLYGELRDEHGVTECFEEIAWVRLINGDKEESIELWALAQALREKNGFNLTSKGRTILEERLSVARLKVSDELFSENWMSGANQNWEQITASLTAE